MAEIAPGTEDRILLSQAIRQSGLTDTIRGRQAVVLDRLIQGYLARTMTDRDAAVGVGVIAELRAIERKLERDVSVGIAETEKLVTEGFNG